MGRTGGNVSRANLEIQMRIEVAADNLFNRRKDNHHIDITDLVGRVHDRIVTDNERKSYAIVRGREQQLIDSHGGAKSDKKNTPLLNSIRGVAKNNKAGRGYHTASNLYFGNELNEYTGNY